MQGLTHIAVVEDDPAISRMMRQCLGEHGFVASAASTGNELDTLLAGERIDLVVLDLGLPGEDGLSICRRIRVQSGVPIIMVTALDGETDRIVGLEMGADDYLPKPFNPRELVARIRAVLRRSHHGTLVPAQHPSVLCFDGWRLDLARRDLFDPSGVPRPLSSGEFNILAAFCQNPRTVLARDFLLGLVHARMAAVFDRSIDVQISRLRRKIEPHAGQPTLIKTVRNGGYVFTPLVTALDA
ncbi:MAG: response regulator [Acetobacteraceae bacterium]|nr:response regulator [Acetobacteraceae bacterium]